MNYISHLNLFYARLHKETRLNANHISLYLALFQCWNSYRFENPFPIWRERVMLLSGIGAKSTYGKCIKELHRFGYIVFNQSLNRYHRPKVSIVRLAGTPGVPQLHLFNPRSDNDTGNDTLPVPALPTAPAKSGTGPVPDSDALLLKIGAASVPISGHINKQFINNVNSERGTHTQDPPLDSHQEMQTDVPRAALAVPSLPEVLHYFKQAGFPETEASLFFNHYQANGWKQGGRIPITDWQAAAGKWMDYDKKIKTQSYAKPGKSNGTEHLHVQPNKDYSEPL